MPGPTSHQDRRRHPQLGSSLHSWKSFTQDFLSLQIRLNLSVCLIYSNLHLQHTRIVLFSQQLIKMLVQVLFLDGQ